MLFGSSSNDDERSTGYFTESRGLRARRRRVVISDILTCVTL